jgi:hypothetical protein
MWFLELQENSPHLCQIPAGFRPTGRIQLLRKRKKDRYVCKVDNDIGRKPERFNF